MSNETNKIKSDCIVVRQSMSAYVDNEVGVSESNMVLEHIRKCSACRVELANMYAIKEMISSSYSLKNEVDFSSNIMARIEPKDFKKPNRSKQALGYFYRYGAAAVVVFALVLSTVMYTGSQTNTMIAEEERYDNYALEHVSQPAESPVNASIISVNFER